MSKETIEWLNTHVLVGMTDQRGNAWHYSTDDQGSESNHYPGAIPVEDVRRRLFGFEIVGRRVAIEVPADIETMTHMSDDGTPMRWDVQMERQAMVTDDTHETLGLFKSGYRGHGFNEWLLDGPANLIDDEIAISSAGLLKNRAVAWVEVSMPETMVACGFTYRPNILACTSFDGTLATTYKGTVGATVCDNTLTAALGESGHVFKAKHSRNSGFKIAAARDALGIVHTMGEAFAADIERLTAQKVTPSQWAAVLDALVPNEKDEKGKDLSKRGVTIANGKRDRLQTMWVSDARVAPWTSTALGVLQAFNTWEHWEKPVHRATIREERNRMDALTGDTDKADAKVLQVLAAL